MVYKRLKSDICLRLLSQRHGQLRSWTLWRRGFTTLCAYFESQCHYDAEGQEEVCEDMGNENWWQGLRGHSAGVVRPSEPEKKRTRRFIFSVSNMMPASDDGTLQPGFLFLVPEKIDYVQCCLFKCIWYDKSVRDQLSWPTRHQDPLCTLPSTCTHRTLRAL